MSTPSLKDELKGMQTSTPNAFAGTPTQVPLSVILSDYDIDQIIDLVISKVLDLPEMQQTNEYGEHSNPHDQNNEDIANHTKAQLISAIKGLKG